MQHGTPEECVTLRVQAMQQEQLRQVNRQAIAEQQAVELRRQQPTIQLELPRSQPVPEVEQAQAAEQKRVRGFNL
jgi:hypothetical protein